MVVDDIVVGDRGAWVGGVVRSTRARARGIARGDRLDGSVSFQGRLVALFGGRPMLSDLARAQIAAAGRPLDLIAAGAAGEPPPAELIAQLRECSKLLEGSRVFYVPAVDLGANIDLPRFILDDRGADVIDLRRRADVSSYGAVLLFTGLSGAGKSTVARELVEQLRARSNRPVLLDGDHVRHELAAELGFGAEDRDKNLRRIAWVAARVAEGGGIAVCAPIAPFASSRASMRAMVEPAHPFIVIYVATALAVAESRDRKGLYAKARAGLIADFTGIDSPYEPPDDADLVIDTAELTVEQSVSRVMELLKSRAIID